MILNLTGNWTSIRSNRVRYFKSLPELYCTCSFSNILICGLQVITCIVCFLYWLAVLCCYFIFLFFSFFFFLFCFVLFCCTGDLCALIVCTESRKLRETYGTLTWIISIQKLLETSNNIDYPNKLKAPDPVVEERPCLSNTGCLNVSFPTVKSALLFYHTETMFVKCS